jgi:hypothetical protein
MRLTELEPRWVASNWDSALGGIKFGITFLCPHCRTQRLAVCFDPPIGRDERLQLNAWADPRANAKHVWKREGDTFDTLTLAPSVDASSSGHWHGFITNGAIR